MMTSKGGEIVKKLMREEAERVEHEVTIQLVTSIPPFRDIDTLRYEKPEEDVESLVHMEWGCPTVDIGVERDSKTGEILSYKEVGGGPEAGSAHSSLSLRRTPADPSQGLMGSSSNMPFLPGGMEIDLFELIEEVEEKGNNGEGCDINPTSDNLLSVPPGFDAGIDFKESSASEQVVHSERNDEKDKELVDAASFDDDDFMAMMDIISTPGTIIPEADAPSEKTSDDSEEVENQENKELEKEVIPTKLVAGGSVSTKKKPERGEQRKIQVEQKPEFAVTLNTQSYVPKFDELVPNPAKKWPFKLDPFQQQAVLCLERGDSVFVAAHTSAGKTVVAEYAVALCQKHLTRAVYTSPIKALSNQKFREFKMGFEDVGLITGDIQIRPEAFCLIMTTEILRSMLYNGSEVIRELEWVIFDEVHYINDSERGVVWEEVLIMLPSHIKIVMLSATVPNTLEFADWVGRIKNRKLYVISTAKRPVPLEHYLYTGTDGKTKNNKFLIVDKNGQFLQQGYKLSVESRAPKKGTNARPNQGFNPKGDRNILITLINHLSVKELLPVVAFTFSRKRCDENAASLTSVDLTTSMEKTEIHYFFSRCIKQLKGTDKRLPQVMQMQELCKRGIAVHHSGILPLLKEVVELLFQQGFVKVLFATETFAMGVNMPARTVVFDSMQKHDGQRKRDLNPGEYVQMAGRAGRRGLDSTGTVILLSKWGPVPEMTDLHRMMLGKPTKLESKFRVTYSMLLNLLRVEQLRIEDMLKRSFAESHSLKNVMSRRDELKVLSKSLREVEKLNCKICQEGDLQGYYKAVLELSRNSSSLWYSLMEHGLISKLLVPGRLIVISCGEEFRSRISLLLKISPGNDRGEKVLSIMIPKTSTEGRVDPEKVNWTEEMEARAWDIASRIKPTAPPLSTAFNYEILEISSKYMTGIVTKIQKINASGIFEDEARRRMPRFRNDEVDKCMTGPLRELQVFASSGSDIQLISPSKDLTCSDIDLFARIQSLADETERIQNYSCVHCLSFKEHFLHVQGITRLEEQKKTLEFSLSSKNLLLLPDYKKKLKVLRSLGYVDEWNMVELKGKVACEIHQEELLVTELILNNVIGNLSTPEIAAVLSCTTCQFRDKDVSLSPHMQTLKAKVMEIATKISVRQRDYEILDGDPTEYLRFDLMEVVYEWARGMPFGQIMEMTNAQEGIIVRCIQRLDEVCKDVRNGARIVGDPNLQSIMEDTSTAIKRDIVFAASLYTSSNVLDHPKSTSSNSNN